MTTLATAETDTLEAGVGPLDRILYPLLVAIPLTTYWFVKDALPAKYAELAPSIAVLPLLFSAAVLEIVRPFYGPWSVRPGQKYILRDFLSTLVMLPIVMKVCDVILRPFDFAAALWPHRAPLVLQLLLAVVAGELSFYWLHRICHQNKHLWRFHKVHHSVTEVHWLNSGFFHVVDAFLNFFFYFLPMRILGVPDQVFAWFLVLTMSTGTLEHANFRYASGFVKLLFNTAELHRLHHSVKMDISRKNYGKITCIWDLLFGTYFTTEDRALILEVGIKEPRPRKKAEAEAAA